LRDARSRLVAELVALSAHDAPSAAPEASTEAVAWLEARLSKLEGAVTRHETSTGIVLDGWFGPTGVEPVLILCHYDTVWPSGTAAERPVRQDGDVVHGPGVFDMRGGIVAALAALELAQPLTRAVRFVLTPDEETGSRGSGELIRDAAGDAALVLVTEPPLDGGALKTSRKGWAGYTLGVRGRAAHAGLEPEKGASAVDELVDRLLDVRRLADPALGTTVNAGVIGGGSAANVVADSAWARIDVRALTVAEQQRVHSELESLRAERAGTSIRLETEVMRPPMERTPAIGSAFARARELAGEIGIDLLEGPAGGASDGNLVAPLGIPVLDGLGPEGGGAHALDEHIQVDSLVERAGLIAHLLRRW
jgi:glutamate carboxypeptidase